MMRLWLRGTALVAGYFLAFIGWLYFFAAVCSLVFNTGGDVGYIVRISGLYIVPGWLLLRGASCLWPFGKRFLLHDRIG